MISTFTLLFGIFVKREDFEPKLYQMRDEREDIAQRIMKEMNNYKDWLSFYLRSFGHKMIHIVNGMRDWMCMLTLSFTCWTGYIQTGKRMDWRH